MANGHQAEKFSNWRDDGERGMRRYRGDGYAEKLCSCAKEGLKVAKECDRLQALVDELEAELAGAVDVDKPKPKKKGKGGEKDPLDDEEDG